MMNRRNFLKLLVSGSVAVIVPLKIISSDIFNAGHAAYKEAIKKIISIIASLRKEGSSINLKMLNHKKYVRDADVHYPNDDSIEDTKTNCQVFFHAHRDDEYGHFHTFINNKDGGLVHLIMISMDKDGNPTELHTLNPWVTGEVYVEKEELKSLFQKFKMNHELFPDKRIIEFIDNIFIGYKEVIFELFDEREQAIKDYIKINAKEPFEDESIEVLSSRAINVYSDAV